MNKLEGNLNDVLMYLSELRIKYKDKNIGINGNGVDETVYELVEFIDY